MDAAELLNSQNSRKSSFLNRRKSSSAVSDFKNRLKNRFQKFKKSLAVEDEQQEVASRSYEENSREIVGKGTVTSFGR